MKLSVHNATQREALITHINTIKIGDFGFQVEIKTGTRTTAQNNAMHKYFSLLATALTDAGYEQVTVIRMQDGAEVELCKPWTEFSVKDTLWGTIMVKMTGKTHTARLTRKEVSKIYEPLNRFTASRMGVSVPFPSNEPPMIGE